MLLHNPDEIKTLYNTKTRYSVMGAQAVFAVGVKGVANTSKNAGKVANSAGKVGKSAADVGESASKTSGVLGWISKHKKPIAAWTAGGVGAGLLISPIGDDITGNVGSSIGGLFGGMLNGMGMIPFLSCGASSCVIVIVILMLVLGN